jgi:hypothetical protein
MADWTQILEKLKADSEAEAHQKMAWTQAQQAAHQTQEAAHQNEVEKQRKAEAFVKKYGAEPFLVQFRSPDGKIAGDTYSKDHELPQAVEKALETKLSKFDPVSKYVVIPEIGDDGKEHGIILSGILGGQIVPSHIGNIYASSMLILQQNDPKRMAWKKARSLQRIDLRESHKRGWSMYDLARVKKLNVIEVPADDDTEQSNENAVVRPVDIDCTNKKPIDCPKKPNPIDLDCEKKAKAARLLTEKNRELCQGLKNALSSGVPEKLGKNIRLKLTPPSRETTHRFNGEIEHKGLHFYALLKRNEVSFPLLDAVKHMKLTENPKFTKALNTMMRENLKKHRDTSVFDNDDLKRIKVTVKIQQPPLKTGGPMKPPIFKDYDLNCNELFKELRTCAVKATPTEQTICRQTIDGTKAKLCQDISIAIHANKIEDFNGETWLRLGHESSSRHAMKRYVLVRKDIGLTPFAAHVLGYLEKNPINKTLLAELSKLLEKDTLDGSDDKEAAFEDAIEFTPEEIREKERENRKFDALFSRFTGYT